MGGTSSHKVAESSKDDHDKTHDSHPNSSKKLPDMGTTSDHNNEKTKDSGIYGATLNPDATLKK